MIEATSIPMVLINLLQPAPNTRLWHRLQREGRLLEEESPTSTTLEDIGPVQSFQPSRPREQILAEYHKVWDTIYAPERYLERTYRYFLGMRPTREALARRQGKTLPAVLVPPVKIPWRAQLRQILVFLQFSWQMGVVSSTRWQYWRQLLGVAGKNPSRFRGYLEICARGEIMFHLHDLLRQRRTGAQGASST